MFNDVINFIRSRFPEDDFIPLHAPIFVGNEKKYLNECIETNFVSSVGKFVDKFEQMGSQFIGSPYAVATVNGTAALHIALKIAGVKPGDEVITQPLSFIATCNAISYCGASPVFVDVDRARLGLSAKKVRKFLELVSVKRDDGCYNRLSGARISAIVPMHTFGQLCDIEALCQIGNEFNIPIVEDSAESIGSYSQDKHSGTFGTIAAFSFNGNKTITTGGGGLIVTANEKYARKAKHLTTTAKLCHPYEYVHDEIGYNYRLPNINAALGCAQFEMLDVILESKRGLAKEYEAYFDSLKGIQFFKEFTGTISNYWLNALIFEERQQRDAFLVESNQNRVMTRPVWQLLNRSKAFSECQCADDLPNATWLADRIVNIPSNARL